MFPRFEGRALALVAAMVLVTTQLTRAGTAHQSAELEQLAHSDVPVCRSAARDFRRDEKFLRSRANDFAKNRNALFVAYEMNKCERRYESRGIVEMMEIASDFWYDRCRVVRRYIDEPSYVLLPPPCNMRDI